MCRTEILGGWEKKTFAPKEPNCGVRQNDTFEWIIFLLRFKWILNFMQVMTMMTGERPKWYCVIQASYIAATTHSVIVWQCGGQTTLGMNKEVLSPTCTSNFFVFLQHLLACSKKQQHNSWPLVVKIWWLHRKFWPSIENQLFCLTVSVSSVTFHSLAETRKSAQMKVKNNRRKKLKGEKKSRKIKQILTWSKRETMARQIKSKILH